MKLSCQIQFLMLILKMQILRRFSKFTWHTSRFKFQKIIAIDKSSQAPSCKTPSISAQPIGGWIDHADFT